VKKFDKSFTIINTKYFYKEEDFMKKFLALLLTLCLVVCTFAACDTNTAEDTAEGGDSTLQIDGVADVVGSLTMGTGGESGTYYAFGGVLSTIIGQVSQIGVTVVSTGGSKDNIVSMDSGIYQLGTVQSDVMTYAYEGTNTFKEDGAIKSFRVVGALYAETVQMVTVDKNIASVADLKGKSVCVGDVGSGTYFNTIDVLKAYDMTINDITPVYQSFGDSTESLKDGKIDAAFLCAGAPTTAVTELAASTPVYLISIDKDHMAKLLEACPYYAEYSIPAGTYEGFDEDTVTVTVKCTLICSEDLDEDLVYALTKIIFEAKDAITDLHAKGAELDLEFATSGITVPFHAGAAKYYKEKGIEVATA